MGYAPNMPRLLIPCKIDLASRGRGRTINAQDHICAQYGKCLGWRLDFSYERSVDPSKEGIIEISCLGGMSPYSFSCKKFL